MDASSRAPDGGPFALKINTAILNYRTRPGRDYPPAQKSGVGKCHNLGHLCERHEFTPRFVAFLPTGRRLKLGI
jgi:hypothetical protein